MSKIDELRRKIAGAITRGDPTADLERELRVALMERQGDDLARAEVTKAQEMARQHTTWQAKAREIVEDVGKQNAGVKRILDAQGNLVKDLRRVSAQLKELLPAIEDAHGRYHILGQWRFEQDTRSIPRKYFPGGFEMKLLHRGDGVSGYGDCPIGVPLLLVENALEILSGLHEARVSLPKGQPEGDLVGDTAASDMVPSCGVCSHPQRVEIDQAILAGTPLRDIERQYGASKSSLSRHKQHLENIS